MTTIKDVARHAGVSFKTVSRVINGEEPVRPEKRERVQAAIRELNYQPSLAARQLAGHKSYIVSLIMPRIGMGYIARMAIAIAAECRAVGYHLNIEVIDVDAHAAPINGDISFSVKPDAVILVPPFSDHHTLMERVEGEGLPLVRIASVREGYGTRLCVDDTDITVALMEHLLSLGHRRIGLVAPPLPEKASETRVTGYRRALAVAGIDADRDLEVRGNFSFASGAAAATQLLALPDRPTAIFAAGDQMALGVMAEAQRLGYRIPDDLAVAGFDDSAESRIVFPALTTVCQPITQIARAAVHAAIGRAGPDFQVQHELRLRGSTTGDRSLCLDRFEF